MEALLSPEDHAGDRNNMTMALFVITQIYARKHKPVTMDVTIKPRSSVPRKSIKNLKVYKERNYANRNSERFSVKVEQRWQCVRRMTTMTGIQAL